MFASPHRQQCEYTIPLVNNLPHRSPSYAIRHKSQPTQSVNQFGLKQRGGCCMIYV